MKLNKETLKKFVALIAGVPILTFVTLYLAYRSNRHEMGGTLVAEFHNRMLNSNDSMSVVVCMEDTVVQMPDVYITPTFSNEDDYSIKDFSLSYDVTLDNIELFPSSFVDSHQYGKFQQIYTYNNTTLSPHDYTKNPFIGFSVKGNYGFSSIKVAATHDVAESSFGYTFNVHYLVVKNINNKIEDWIEQCKKEIKKYNLNNINNIYYCSNNRKTEYFFGVSLPYIEEKESPSKDNAVSSSSNENKGNKEAETGLEIENYKYSGPEDAILDVEFNKICKSNQEICVLYTGKEKGLKNVENKIARLTPSEGQKKYSLKLEKKFSKLIGVRAFLKVDIEDYCDIERNFEDIVIKNNSDYEGIAIVQYKDLSSFWSIVPQGSVKKYNNNDISKIDFYIDENSKSWLTSLPSWLIYILMLVVGLLFFIPGMSFLDDLLFDTKNIKTYLHYESTRDCFVKIFKLISGVLVLVFFILLFGVLIYIYIF